MDELYLHKVREKCQKSIDEFCTYLAGCPEIVDLSGSVYATGSFGRLEAGPPSDLDVFIVALKNADPKSKRESSLSVIDEIKIKYNLIKLTEEFEIPPFDGGGKYLNCHIDSELTENLGTAEDDYKNTLTARLLLLLESRCIFGEEIYNTVIKNCIDKYFIDYEGHEHSFKPAFFINDISRMWRTFCVNYESNRKIGDGREKIKNLKLKYIRMLTCYSAAIYLQAHYAKNGTVSPSDALAMVHLSPMERLEYISNESFWGERTPQSIYDLVKNAIILYSEFLELVHLPQPKVSKVYRTNATEWQRKSEQFGHLLSCIIDSIGEFSDSGKAMRRLILI